MNSYERYQAVLAGQTPDFLPRLPILMAFAARFIGSNYAAFASDYRALVEANLTCAAHFDFDQVSVISDPYRETQGFGAEIEYLPDSVPRCVKPPLEDDRDFTRLPVPDPLRSERMRDRVRAVEEYQKRCWRQYSILGWVEGPAAEAADLRGVTRFLLDLLEDPDYAGRLMDHCVDVGIAFAAAQVQAGADTIGIGDAIASQVSAETYETLIFPRELRLVAGLKKRGCRVRLHICGNTSHLLPYFPHLQADIIDLDWQVSMGEARRRLGAETSLCGNLDPVHAVAGSTPERIQAALAGIYHAIGNRYLVGAGCEIPVDTPEANLKALCRPLAWMAG